MMIDVPSDAPNFTFTVANESPSRLLTWPEASLPATAVTGRIKASSTAVAVSTTVAFCPGRACTSFGNRHCSVRVDSVPCAVVADPAVSSAEEGGVATPLFTTAAQSVGPCASVIWNQPVNGWSGSMVASSAVASTLALMPPYRIENSG